MTVDSEAIRLMAEKPFIKLSVIFFVCFGLWGCPSKEGAAPVDEPEVFFPDPPPAATPPPVDINQAFYGFIASPGNDPDASNAEAFSQRDGSLSVLTYDPDLPLDRDPDSTSPNPQTAFISDIGLVVALDTVFGAEFEAEFSMLSRNDTIYTLNHETGEIRGLGHFRNRVCDIIPAKRVEVSGTSGADEIFTVVDELFVYIETTEGLCEGDDSGFERNARRYYKLPVNYKYDASDAEICVGEGDGKNNNPETCKSKAFSAVLESEAKAELVWAWEEDNLTADPTDHSLTWGYLGYGFVEQELKFFNAAREQVWSQSRMIEGFDIVNLGQAEFTKPYHFSVHPLANPNDASPADTGFVYLVQIGRDIFVMDSTHGLFDVDAVDRATVLSDRIYKLDVQTLEGSSSEIISQLEYVYDDDEVVWLDQAKVIRYNYDTDRFVPNFDNSVRSFTIRNAGNDYAAFDARSKKPFSQFDIESCLDEPNQGLRDACTNAHDVEDAQLPAPGPAWEFVVDCTASVGCSFVTDTNDYCVTEAELALNPSLANLNNPCSTRDYRHLNELDQATNDADFRGYMQYANDYVRSLDMKLENDSLLITASMREKDILLQYFYQQPLTAPRSDREWVLLGGRFEHFSLESYLEEGNLFVTLLRRASLRSNECYKNYQNVTCNLGELVEEGANDECTGVDLALGLCFNTFQEFKSYALYCGAADVAARTCTESACMAPGGCNASEAPVYNLLVDPVEARQGKWVQRIEASVAGPQTAMVLLGGPDAQDDISLSDDSFVRDEGVLVFPQLYDVDAATGILSTPASAKLKTQVETVGVLSSIEPGNELVQVISNDVVQIGGGTKNAAVSELSQLISTPTSPTISNVRQVEETASYQFLRPITERQ